MDSTSKWLTSLARPGPGILHMSPKGRQTAVSYIVLFLFLLISGCGRSEVSQVSSDDIVDNRIMPLEFTDIDNHHAEQAVLQGLEMGLWIVPADGQFRPYDAASVRDFLTALWIASGKPEESIRTTGNTNDDTTGAVSWAISKGWVNKTALDKPLTRQKAMNILYEHNGGVSGIEAMLTAVYDDGFLDSSEIPPKGKAALYWGFYNLLIRETEPEKIDPNGAVSRGDMAEMLISYRNDFIEGTPTK